MEDQIFLREALQEAKKALLYGEVPIGALIVKDGQIVSRAFNRKEFLQDPTAHAEIIAIREASRKLNSWRLTGCTLYTTVEPCIMCAGAIIQSRVERVVYSVADPKFGGVESLFKVLSDERVNHRPEVVKLELPEASELLKEFFRLLRQ